MKRETFEEYRERKEREDAAELAQEQKLEDAEGMWRQAPMAFSTLTSVHANASFLT